MMCQDFTLRPATQEDMPVLNAFCYSEAMGKLDGPDDIVVAADDDNDPIGFIQILQGANHVAHVYPIVVNDRCRAKGVGRALIQNAHDNYGELRLVSRGSSIGFYEKLGFVECGWDDIDHECTEGCIDCSVKDQCFPKPMLLK